MITKDLRTAERLINTLMNEIINRWSGDSSAKCYLVRHTERSDEKHIVIQPTYSDTFYAVEDFIHVAEVCGCSFYINCEPNLANVITPTLHIY